MKTILIIEDSPLNLNKAVLALRGKANFKLAMDLKGAMAIIAEGDIDGVITDLCFQEVGVNVPESYAVEEEYAFMVQESGHIAFTLKKADALETETRSLFEESLRQSRAVIKNDGVCTVSYLGKTSNNLRQEVIANTICCFGKVKAAGIGWKLTTYIQDFNSEKPRGLKLSAAVPALGYFVITKCLELGTPVSFISTTRHADHVYPVPLAAGLITEEEFATAVRDATESTCGIDITTPKGIYVGDYDKNGEHWLKCFDMLQIVA